MDFAKLIKNERLKQDLSQSELSRRAGLSRKMVTLIESGQRNASLETKIRLLRTLRFSKDYIKTTLIETLYAEVDHRVSKAMEVDP